MPADLGVVGLVIMFGDLESGNGKEAVLRRASRAMFSSGEGLLTSRVGGRELDPEELGFGVAGERGALPGDLAVDFDDAFAGDLG